MAVDKSYIGRTTSRSRVTIERGPVSNFARAVKDESPVYRDPGTAKSAGFASIPAPPTFGFVAAFWGSFPEQQPPPEAGMANPFVEVIGALARKGGIVLHGEQEFVYHRPILVGDMLRGEGKVVDLYEKESKGKTMTFVVTETVYRDEKTLEPVLTMRFNLVHRSA